LAAVDEQLVLAAYDQQIRRATDALGSGAIVELNVDVVRWVKTDNGGWSGVTWSQLDETTADDAIARQVEFYGGLGHRFEWKHHDHDVPADLSQRLVAAGFRREDHEALMVAEVDAIPHRAELPDGVTLRRITGEADVDLLIRVHESVFGTDHADLGRSLRTQLRTAPEVTELLVAMAGDRPVCSARIEFYPGTDFAGLWGGGTEPEWRGRGIYRALVAERARLAAERGFRFLQVDATADSRPILERLGFRMLATTTPHVWEPTVG
jgi:GNAT superfamily N-acetyltransferase